MSNSTQQSGRATQIPQPLSTTLRAPRVVVIFNGDEGWETHAARAIFKCSQIWGGSGFVLIPHHQGEVHVALRRMATAYDPDYVVVLPTTLGEFEAWRPGALPFTLDGRLLEGAERDELIHFSQDQRMTDEAAFRARKTLAADCTPHRMWLQRERVDDDGHSEQLQAFDARAGGPLTPLSAMQIEVDPETGVPPSLHGRWALAAAIHAGFGSEPPIPFPLADPMNLADCRRLADQALQALRRRRDRPLFTAQPWPSAWASSETELATIEPWQAKQKPDLVVVGTSPDDFALAHGWSVMFGNGRWIPEAEFPLLGPWGAASARMADDLVPYPPGERDDAIVTSTSVDAQVLHDLISGWLEPQIRAIGTDPGDMPGMPQDTGSPSRVPPKDLDFAYGGLLALKDQYDMPNSIPAEVNDQGDIEFLIDLPPMMPTSPTLDGAPVTWQIDLFVPSATPRMRGLSPRVLVGGTGFPGAFVRSGKHSLTCFSGSWGFVAAGSNRLHRMATPRLLVPGILTWAQTLAEDGSLTASFSPAGHRVEILRRMWGSRADLVNDWAGPLRPLFLAFRASAKTTSDAFPHGGGLVIGGEAYLSFEGMATALSTSKGSVEVLRREVDRLIEIGILRRGLVLNCGLCGKVALVPINDLGTSNACARCGGISPLTLDRWRDPVAEPTWWYDLHPAARELLAEDAGVALMCSAHLRSSAQVFGDVSELEFFDPDRKAVAEIDLLACRDDRVTVGEAKSRATLGGSRDRSSKARKLSRIARLLRADEVLLCTTAGERWPEVDVKAIREALAKDFKDSSRPPDVRTVSGLGSDNVLDEIRNVATT